MAELSRRTFLEATGVSALATRLLGASELAYAAPALAQAQVAQKPNFLFMLVDNLGYGELGAYGGGATRGAPTPRIDKLASEGLRLTNMNMEAQCTPSRSAILTGRYAIRSGTHSVPFGGVADGLTQWEVTMAESLSAAGYATALYGKWHLGSQNGRLPNDQGFDEWYGIPRTTDEALWPSSPGYSPSVMPPEQIMEGKKGEKSRDVRVYDIEQRRLIDAEITRRTVAFMERQTQARKPFFAYATLTQPHLPTLPNPAFAGKTGNGDWADMLAEMDANVGQMLDAVDRLGIRDNTIVIFTSDNGPEFVRPYDGWAGPWRGQYFTAWEGGIRVPFMIRWPGHVPAGRVSDAIVHCVDLFHWPTGGGGFQYFYGFVVGVTHQYYPNLFEGTTRVEPKKTPEQGYTLNEDLADHTINWIRQQKALAPNRPFFVYYAPGATHAPHHVPKEWADKYKGKFDQGWDRLREETYARQKTLGVIPKECELTKRHEEIPAWYAVDPKMKPVLCRQMEVYAGFMEQTDHHVGRVIDALANLNILDETVVYLIIGDNGASAEGSLQGTFNEMVTLGGFGHLETAESLMPRIDEFGSPTAYNHYAVGWAHAMDTPYQWTKQVASHWGGTRNGAIVHWPKGIKSKGELRTQFHHVIDVAPTVLELAGVPQPLMVNGVMQRPIEGVSMAYSFNDAAAAERHETQYFEMFGNRGIYHKGWTAVTKHRTPWETGQVKTIAFDDDVWELYDTSMVNLANKSYAVTAEIEVPASGAEGVMVAVGGVTGGWSLYAKSGKPKFCYNFFGLQQTFVEGASVVPPGQHQVRMEFAYDGGGLAKGGMVSLFVDGNKAGNGRVEQTEPFAFGEESLDVGHEAGSPVTTDYPGNHGAEFSGQVNWVEFDAGTAADDHNHLITPEERLQVAMAKQ